MRNRKSFPCVLLALLIVCLLAVPAAAAGDPPVITMQPQSPTYPEYSVASYKVCATGSNLRAIWYLEWQGNTYNLSDNTNPTEPWEGFAGESYGGFQEDANTFLYFFSGIGRDLDGGYIYCVIEDGHYDVVSEKARISISEAGNPNPPTIEDIPAEVTVAQGEEAEIRCLALAPGDTQLSFLWYETDTGRMEDMRAMNRGEETADYIFCDTSQVGTRYYLCMVETSAGGIAYSSVVKVTVTEKTAVIEPPAIETNVLTEGQVGKAYKAKIACSDPNAQFSLYYSPGGTNEFEKAGLTLAKDGTISGTPKTAGEISFSVCAAGQGGEDYMTYTLVIREAPTTPPTTTPPATTPPATTLPTQPGAPADPTASTQGKPAGTSAPTQATKPQADPSDKDSNAQKGNPVTWIRDAFENLLADGIPGWLLILVGVVSAGIGAGVAMILTKKKS